MHVGVKLLGGRGKVEVDDMADLGNVQAPRRNIGCHHDHDLALPESIKDPLPLGLVAVTVNGIRLDTILPVELPAHPISRRLLLNKHERAPLHRLHRLCGERELLPLVVGGLDDDLLDALHRRPHAPHRDPHILVHKLCRELLDGSGERRAEHERLALRLGRHVALLDDLPDLGLEAHVEHSVCLIQHQKPRRRERHHPPIHKVNQPPGGRHEDLPPERELVELPARRRPPVHHDGVDVGSVGQLPCLEMDLKRQLPGRRHNHRVGGGGPHLDALELVPAAVAVELAVVGVGAADGPEAALAAGLAAEGCGDGEEEGTRLARAGLGAAHEVLAEQRVRDGVALDGGRVGVLHESDRM
mmetsp:Transcript_47563/g.118938  ORF Transcript_47563/g.118938 Transcript_47563/m.118938 type:complete len:357 (-) Transcript_47563:312-1382(-)